MGMAGIIHFSEDIRTVFSKDPAARSKSEVLLCYPGIHAIWSYRITHWLWQHRMQLSARFISHISRFFTGIEIHPGATIGRRCFIDHGMGVVIGETAEIGDDVLIYMGVVLGGTALERVKRHPTIGNQVVIGSGASVLGPITVGDGAKIGAGAVVVRSVPPGATVVGVPGRIAGPECEPPAPDSIPSVMPDPMLRVVSRLLDRQNRLEERLRNIERIAQGIIPEDRKAALVIEGEVRDALREVIDPEVGIDIVDFGLIKEIIVSGDHVEVDLVLTTRACPLVDHLTEQIQRKLSGLEGVRSIEVKVLDEPWAWDRFVRQDNSLKLV
jgi:serine O-acetyltransferase